MQENATVSRLDVELCGHIAVLRDWDTCVKEEAGCEFNCVFQTKLDGGVELVERVMELDPHRRFCRQAGQNLLSS